MSYAEMVLATVPAAPPTEKNQRATSCPPPISANDPYVLASRLSASAFSRVVSGTFSIVKDSLNDCVGGAWSRLSSIRSTLEPHHHPPEGRRRWWPRTPGCTHTSPDWP